MLFAIISAALAAYCMAMSILLVFEAISPTEYHEKNDYYKQ